MNGYSDKLQTALLALLRSGLWERELDNPSCFPLSEEDWGRLFRLSRQQTVTGIVFQGIHYLPDELFPSENLLIRWTAEVDAIERRNSKMNRTLSELYSLFCSQNLNPVLQKGQGVARFYEKPFLRECGDIDFYFNNQKDQSAAAAYIQSCGIPIKRMSDKSWFYPWKGIDIEHHVRLFDLYNPSVQQYANLLEREKGYAAFLLPDSDLPIRIPAPFLNLLLLNLHILKHALGWGIGLRQLCDMARACYRLHDQIDTDEMETVCREWGLSRWNPLLHSFLVKQLGLPVRYLPYPDVAPTAQPLLDIVWRGGNFGYQMEQRNQSGRSAWKRKLETVRSFRKNVGFSLRYAPKEIAGLWMELVKGQIGK